MKNLHLITHLVGRRTLQYCLRDLFLFEDTPYVTLAMQNSNHAQRAGSINVENLDRLETFDGPRTKAGN
jgi:hypothetical protein